MTELYNILNEFDKVYRKKNNIGETYLQRILYMVSIRNISDIDMYNWIYINRKNGFRKGRKEFKKALKLCKIHLNYKITKKNVKKYDV